MVTGRSGADLKATEKEATCRKRKRRKFTHQACCNLCNSHYMASGFSRGGLFVGFLQNLNDHCPILSLLHGNPSWYLCVLKIVYIIFWAFPPGFSKEHPRSKALTLRDCPGEHILERGLSGPITILLLSFPPVLRKLNCSFIEEQSFFQATKGPDLLYGR